MPITDDMQTAIGALIATGKLALYTTIPNPDSADPGVEVSGGSYARQNVTMMAAPGNPGLMRNSAAVNFNGMPTCTVVGIGLFNAANTTLLYYTTLSPAVSFTSGDVAQVAINAFAVTFGE